MFAPVDGPEKRPSCASARRAIANASAVITAERFVEVVRGEQVRHEARPATFDSVCAGLPAGEHRRLTRFDSDAMHALVASAQRLAHAEEAARGPDVETQRVDRVGQLGKDLRAQLSVAVDHVGVAELIGLVAADLLRELRGASTHAWDQLRRDACRGSTTISSRAPNASIVRSFSSANASDVTMCNGYPLTAQTNASELPVLPPVYSTTG